MQKIIRNNLIGNSQLNAPGSVTQSISDTFDLNKGQVIYKEFEIVWIDDQLNNEKNQQFLTKLSEYFGVIDTFETIDAYKKYFYSIPFQDKVKKFIVIVSGNLGKNLMEIIHQSIRIVHVCVLSENIEDHRIWTVNYNKIRCLVNNLDELVTCIDYYIKLYGYEMN